MCNLSDTFLMNSLLLNSFRRFVTAGGTSNILVFLPVIQSKEFNLLNKYELNYVSLKHASKLTSINGPHRSSVTIFIWDLSKHLTRASNLRIYHTNDLKTRLSLPVFVCIFKRMPVLQGSWIAVKEIRSLTLLTSSNKLGFISPKNYLLGIAAWVECLRHRGRIGLENFVYFKFFFVVYSLRSIISGNRIFSSFN